MQAARAVANSIARQDGPERRRRELGTDPGGGRILGGRCSILRLSRSSFGDLPILRQNYQIDFSEERAKEILSRREIAITIDLHRGEASASFWTCDLSKEYVAINANYRT